MGLARGSAPSIPAASLKDMRLSADHPDALTQTNSVVFSARVPRAVAARLDAEAARDGLSRSDWLRRQALGPNHARVTGARQPRRPRKVSDPKLILNLARIGSNLNQLAHAANVGTLAGSKVDALAVLRRIELAVAALLEREAA